MKAVRVHENGGSDKLRVEDIPTPTPGSGEALVKIEVAGVNFIDVYHRTGLYPGKLPFTIGVEAAGVVAAIGPDVDTVNINDRVMYCGIQGSYAEYAVVPVSRLVPVPSDIDFQQAVAACLQGMTAHFLSHSTYPIQAGNDVVIHAAAGGVGLLLVQMAKQRGARVFGTVSTEEKAQLARAAGADEIIFYNQADVAAEVKQKTGGKGAHVVYDSVGQATFANSLDALRPRGMLVLFGQSSGPVAPVDPAQLNAKGSLYLTRPSLFHYVAERSELLAHADAVLSAVARGELRVRIDRALPLSEAAEAHNLLESRATSGKLLLLPGA